MGVGMGVGTQAALDRPTVDPCLRSLQIMAPNLNITFTWPNAFHSDRSGKGYAVPVRRWRCPVSSHLEPFRF